MEGKKLHELRDRFAPLPQSDKPAQANLTPPRARARAIYTTPPKRYRQREVEIDTAGQPCLPMGKYKGQRISAMDTKYLSWFITQDNLREKYSPTAKAILAELRARFQVAGQVEGELLPDDVSDLV